MHIAARQQKFATLWNVSKEKKTGDKVMHHVKAAKLRGKKKQEEQKKLQRHKQRLLQEEHLLEQLHHAEELLQNNCS
jgi:hypothetical protein